MSDELQPVPRQDSKDNPVEWRQWFERLRTQVNRTVSDFTGIDIADHLNDSDIHFEVGDISHQSISGAGAYPHASIDSHIDNTGLHFSKSSISHTEISDIGVNTHTQIDSHLSDSSIHFTADSLQHQLLNGAGAKTHADIDTHLLDSSIHFTKAGISHTEISNIGTYTHAQLDAHIMDSSVHFTASSIDHGSISGLTDDDHLQYHNDSRALTWLGTRSTTDLAEGTNLYYTDARVQSVVSASYIEGLGVDHGSLAGLGDDDHTHYFLADGSRILAGPLTQQGGIVQFNTLQGNYDHIIYGQSGIAYKFDAGLDYHLWSGDWESDVFKYQDITTGGTNSFYIGTTGSSTSEGNYLWGESAGQNLTTGAHNFYAGHQVGQLSETAFRNVGLGFRALQLNVDGSRSIGIGYYALGKATGSYNLGIGSSCGQNITTGQYNTLYGSDCATNLTTGDYNFVLGSLSAQALTTGNNNIIIGADAGRTAHNKNNLLAIGWQAGRNANSASSVFLGREAGFSETTDQRLHIANNKTESLVLGYFDTRYLQINGILKTEAERGTPSSVATSTTLTHTITYVRQTASGITTTLWASPTDGDRITIANRSGGATTIAGNGTNLEGSSSVIIYDGESFDLEYDGTEWVLT